MLCQSVRFINRARNRPRTRTAIHPVAEHLERQAIVAGIAEIPIGSHWVTLQVIDERAC